MSFEQVIGHNKIKKIFENIVSSNKIGNAYLFSGIAGIGKKTFAKEVAKTLNCLDQKKSLPCNSCINCKRMNDGNYPDFHLIEPSGKQLKVEQIRDVVKECSYAPVEIGKRIIIINDAHLMNPNAANCFLKTLEETKSSTVFFLISSNINALLPTIISRCQVIKFSPLTDNELVQILKKEKIDFNLELIELFGLGSIETAVGMNSKHTVQKIFDNYKKFSDIKKKDFEKIFAFCESLMNEYEDVKDIIIIFKILFNELLKSFMEVKSSKLKNLEKEYNDIIEKLMKQNSLNLVLNKISFLNNFERESFYNLNKRLSTEKLVLNLV